jgi:hypothetical protein
VVAGYNSVPIIELDRLPRGGMSMETKAVGRVQVCTIQAVSLSSGMFISR